VTINLKDQLIDVEIYLTEHLQIRKEEEEEEKKNS
jgi:hypothetical protein